jgi:2,3-bisphosphoglycerate-independent phosphoglycerate mutase
MKQVVLIVLDGFGIAPPGPGNAIYLANPVNINSFQATYPHTVLKASGEAVGLPQTKSAIPRLAILILAPAALFIRIYRE